MSAIAWLFVGFFLIGCLSVIRQGAVFLTEEKALKKLIGVILILSGVMALTALLFIVGLFSMLPRC